MFGSARRRERKERIAAGFLPEWRELLSHRVSHWPYLDDDERARLEEIAFGLIVDASWEAAHGFELDDEIIVTIAGQAALIAIGLPDDCYRDVGTIIVHPTTLLVEGEHSLVEGIVSDEPTDVLGEAHYEGPVVIVWDAALREARHPGRGRNVVFHEFAHKLDMLDGTVDGTPPLATREQLDRWVDVCTRVFEQVARGEGGHSLDPYAGVNPAEFFAVATEVFFDDPSGLRHDHPDLYDVLADYFRQDPLARARRRRVAAAADDPEGKYRGRGPSSEEARRQARSADATRARRQDPCTRSKR